MEEMLNRQKDKFTKRLMEKTSDGQNVYLTNENVINFFIENIESC